MLSVLLATHNGADTIERTLAAMSELEAPTGGWKLVVVNNASTDNSEARILQWRDRLPLEYLVEPRLGKANAMNTAFDHAEGDFIVMTDDDILPERNWLTEWRRVADSYPEVAVFGGSVVPAFDERPPSWLIDDGCFGLLYGQTPSTPEGEVVEKPYQIMAGANLAIRKSATDAGWRFGEHFLVGKNGLMGEDHDLVQRLWENGHKVGFSPKSRVRHIIHKEQMTWRWILRRCFRNGRYVFLSNDAHWDEASNRFVFRFPYWRCRESLEYLPRLIVAALRRDLSRLFGQSRYVSNHLGMISQALTLVWRQKSFFSRSR